MVLHQVLIIFLDIELTLLDFSWNISNTMKIRFLCFKLNYLTGIAKQVILT